MGSRIIGGQHHRHHHHRRRGRCCHHPVLFIGRGEGREGVGRVVDGPCVVYSVIAMSN